MEATGAATMTTTAAVVSPTGRAALWYAGRGLRVHPLRAGSKLPMLSRWQDRATTAAATIADWWTRWPDAGVGIGTGTDSRVVAVDIDNRHGGDDALAALEREHGEVPTTWRCLTAGGGLHLYVRHPGGHVGNRAGMWPGIDLRGDGGYVVAPPTTLDDGRLYAWEAGHGPHEIPPMVAPGWLLERIRPAVGAAAGHAPAYWRGLVCEGIAEGGRNHAVAQLAGHLFRRGVDPFVALELTLAWNARRCRPPLPDAEVVRSVNSIARKEAARRGALS